MNTNTAVSNYIKNSSPQLAEIMESLRDLIREAIPDTTEEFKWSQPVFKKKKDFCYLKVAKNHVTFGFINAQNLKDPDSLLEGTGKIMRHIKLSSTKDIRVKLFKFWLQALTKE